MCLSGHKSPFFRLPCKIHALQGSLAPQNTCMPWFWLYVGKFPSSWGLSFALFCWVPWEALSPINPTDYWYIKEAGWVWSHCGVLTLVPQGLGNLYAGICFPRPFGFVFCLQAPSVVRRMYINKQKNGMWEGASEGHRRRCQHWLSQRLGS